MKISKFNFSGASLIFRIDENDWCRVELATENDTLQLGAETWNILSDRLKGALTNLSKSKEPEWILTLSEKHCGFYRQNVDGKNSFFWIDAEGNKIWKSKLGDPLDENDFNTFTTESAL